MAEEKKHEAPVDSKKTMLHEFTNILGELIDALHDFLPDSPEVQDQWETYYKIVKHRETGTIYDFGAKAAINRWHNEMKDHYADFKAGDIDKLLQANIPMLVSLNIVSKWDSFNEESRHNLMQYIEALNFHASVYFAVPDKLMNRVNSIATRLTHQMEQGAFNMNHLDVMGLAKQATEGFSEEEIMEMAQNMGDISNLFAMAQKQLGNQGDLGSSAMAQQMNTIVQTMNGLGLGPPSQKKKK